MRLQRAPVGPAGRHRDLRLQLARERELGRVRLTEVLDDLLLLLLLLGLTHKPSSNLYRNVDGADGRGGASARGATVAAASRAPRAGLRSGRRRCRAHGCRTSRARG